MCARLPFQIRLNIATALLCALASSHVGAASLENSYLGVQLNRIQVELPPSTQDAELTALSFSAGHALNRYFALELRGALGSVEADELQHNGNSYELSLNYLLGGYAVFTAPLGPVDLYAFGGATKVELKAEPKASSTALVSARDIDTGLGYGAGVGYYFSPRLRLAAEYGRLLTGDNLDSAGLALSWHF